MTVKIVTMEIVRPLVIESLGRLHLNFDGRTYQQGPTFPQRSRQIAADICQHFSDRGRECLLVDSPAFVSIWTAKVIPASPGKSSPPSPPPLSQQEMSTSDPLSDPSPLSLPMDTEALTTFLMKIFQETQGSQNSNPLRMKLESRVSITSFSQLSVFLQQIETLIPDHNRMQFYEEISQRLILDASQALEMIRGELHQALGPIARLIYNEILQTLPPIDTFMDLSNFVMVLASEIETPQHQEHFYQSIRQQLNIRLFLEIGPAMNVFIGRK